MPEPVTTGSIATDILLRAFPGIPRTEAQDLILSGKVQHYPASVVLCHEDETESTFYIIIEGSVKVTKRISHDQVRHLKTLCRGDFFGEMGLIQNAPRAASVTTLEPTTVLEIHKEAFDRLLPRSASLSLAMAKEVSRRLRENDAMAIEDLRVKAGELAAAYQQLAEQDYARREFLTTIAHELRTPLTTANGYLHMVLEQVTKQPELLPGSQGQVLHGALENVERSVQQIVSLVNDLLFLQEMDLILPAFQPIQIGMILKAVAERYRKVAAENRIEIQLEIDPHLPEISGDLRSLERAFAAILDNAIKFSPDGGVVQIHAHRSRGARRAPEAQRAAISIEFNDPGVGIPDEVLPRIFDRFYHVDEVQGRLFRGLGLGLSIARHVIEQHHGQIEVASRLGQGTRITVILVG